VFTLPYDAAAILQQVVVPNNSLVISLVLWLGRVPSFASSRTVRDLVERTESKWILLDNE
jgi:hypothetical protein